MTEAQFLKRLRQTPRGWKLRNGKLLRLQVSNNENVDACPITALTGRGCGYYQEDARRLKILVKLRDRIVAAADRVDREKFMRKKLLKACGLA